MKKIIAIILLCCSITAVHAQTSTEGTDFWFGFMENDGANITLELYISARTQANVQIRSLRGFQRDLTVQPGATQRVIVPISHMPTIEGLSDRGIHVTSDEPISVYQLNKRQFSADAAVILPTNTLGKEYYVTAHMEPPEDIEPNARESEFLVVAVENNTEVEITPSHSTFNNWPANVPQVVTLDAGETYFVKSNEDLSGSFVRTINSDANDCKNVAVFGGNVFTNVGGCGGFRDHLIEQMFPVSTWGKEFVFVPYLTRSGGDYIKIIASENNTLVKISGSVNLTLDAGEVYINKALDGIRTITADKPISLAQFSRSGRCDGRDADPFMIIVSPIEQRVQQVTFSAFTVQEIDQYFLTLITESDALNNIVLDGVDITNQFTTIFGYAYLEIEIDRGDHTIDAPEGIIAYVYGYGEAESFGYSAGVSLENLNLEILGEDEFIGEIIQEACVDAEIVFDASFETEPGNQPRYDTFSWDFGDGNMAEGVRVTHVYDTPGEYVVTILASQGAAACGTSETINRTIQVTETEVSEITGAISVCPDVTDIAYSVEGPADNTYEWSVAGGTITSGQGTNEILVDWGVATDFASVSVVPINALGCRGSEEKLSVIINKRLEPALPRADSPTDTEVCYTDRNRVRYFTPATNGSEYEWFVTGGTFTADTDNSTNEVFVDWGSNTSGKVWYREFNPNISDCEGFSDELLVTIYPEIVPVADISNALCFGDANGSISLSISGGKSDVYSVAWDNGMTGLLIEGLVAGDYIATIRDELGCEISTEAYTVTEPNVLEFVSTGDVLPVRCFEESNGEINVTVQGGTLPYTYSWSGEGIATVTNTPELTALKSGTYEVTVTDANGCTALLPNIFVSEPALLEADLESLINEPICPDASDGIAFIDAKGGTPDYQFYWSNNTSTDNAETTGLSKGAYEVRIVDANGCETTYTLQQDERDPKVFVPNAFSPNGDGQNDEFKPVADCPVTYSLQVFNKWGTIVFSTNDINEGWDGTYNGSSVQMGKYSYVLFWSATINNVVLEENYRGTVNIYK